MSDRLQSMRARIRRLKTLPVLPTLLTAGNLASGVTAILFAADGQLEVGAILIFVAMVCDMFDGKVARLTKTDGPFGAELDSLADVVSFGVAPAVLLYHLIVGGTGDTLGVGKRLLWFFVVFYPVMAAIRLARYNVEHSDAPTNHFRGLPSPGAAAVVCAWVIFSVEFGPQMQEHGLFRVYDTSHVYTGLLGLDTYRVCSLVVLLGAALLMVSNVPYPHVGNTLLGRISFGSFIILLLLVVLLVTWPAPTLIIGTTGYALFGLGLAAVRAWQNWQRGRNVLDDEDDEEAEDVGTGRIARDIDEGPATGR